MRHFGSTILSDVTLSEVMDYPEERQNRTIKMKKQVYQLQHA